MGQSMEDTAHEIQEPKAWVVYSTVPHRELAAAFSDKSVATKLHQLLAESEAPVLVSTSDISVIVDELAPYISAGSTPFQIVLENGELMREDTYESETFNLRKPSFEPGHPEIFAGTYWAFSIDFAISNAVVDWKKQSAN